jgi:hypothetical protein
MPFEKFNSTLPEAAVTPEKMDEASGRVAELVHPQTTRELQDAIENDMFQGQQTPEQIRECLEGKKYDPLLIEADGRELRERIEAWREEHVGANELKNSLEREQYTTWGNQLDAMTDAYESQRVVDLTLGAMYKVSHQLYRLLEVSVTDGEVATEPKPEQKPLPGYGQLQAMGYDLLTLKQNNVQGLIERQRAYIQKLEDRNKKEQYAYVASLLNHRATL